MLTEFPFDIDALKKGEDLFPSAIADDPWIAYHGTSGRNARSIEEDGLQGSMGVMSIAGHVSREMLEHYSHIRLQAKRQALQALETGITATSQSTSQNGKPAEAGFVTHSK